MEMLNQACTFKLWVLILSLAAATLFSSWVTYQVAHLPTAPQPICKAQPLVCPPCLAKPARDDSALFHNTHRVPNNDGKRF